MIWTPDKIKQCLQDDDGDAIDCFASAVPDSPFKERMVKALWATWRYAICDTLNPCKWLQLVTDRADLIDTRYQLLFEEFDKQQAVLASIKSGWTETYQDSAEQGSSGSDTVVNTHEDIPQTQGAGASEWLSSRDRSTSTPGVSVTTESSGSREHVDNAILPGERFADVMGKLRSPYVQYALEFKDLFADYWNIEGGCGCDCCNC